MFNALHHSLEPEPEWGKFYALLKSTCRILGQRQWKDPVIHRLFQGASEDQRGAIEGFHGSHLDWRLGVPRGRSRFVARVSCSLGGEVGPACFVQAGWPRQGRG
eukprot:3361015-Alexandrium_andersonii.AAC.1